MRPEEKGIGAGLVLCLAAGILCNILGKAEYGAIALIAAVALGLVLLGLNQRWTAQRQKAEAEAKAAAERKAVREAEAVQAAAREETQATLRQWQSSLTHSLRMPFSVILGYAELLQNGMVKDEAVQQEYLTKIRDRVVYLNDVVSQLMLERRVAASEPACVPETLDLVALAKGMVEDIRSVAEEKHVEVRLVSAEEGIRMEADPTQLQKLFYNVLENALKYMKRAGTITVTLSQLEGESVLLAFKDDGEGLPEEEAGHIFDLNYQGSNREEGSGLGLHLVRQIVLAHGGEITARSRKGQGFGLYIELPLEQKKS